VFLSALGRRRDDIEFPHAEVLAGITDPPLVRDADFFVRWLRQSRAATVELTCHPGEEDQTLLGRDAKPGDGHLERRVRELELLLQSQLRDAICSAGFQLTRPSQMGTTDLARRKAG
jgi:predicted glycoside hydrolase/deacetylase ChbG (UPF0249 family)